MDPMSIANLSTAMANSQTMNQVGMSVMGMALSDATQIAAGEAAMIDALPRPALEASVNPAVGGGIDVSV